MSNIINPYRFVSGGGYDSLAQAFFTAAGISDNTEKSAVNTLILNLRTAGISPETAWLDIRPFVGGTASTHSYNLVNTATFQITWMEIGTGTPATHDAAGVHFTGTSNSDGSFGKLGIIPATHFTSNSFGIAYYTSSTSDRSNALVYGCSVSGGDLLYRWNATTGVFYNQIGTFQTSSAFPSMAGLHSTNRRSSSITNVNKDGVQIDEFTGDTATTYPTIQLTIGGTNYFVEDNVTNLSSQVLSFFGTKKRFFSTTEEADLYNIVQAFETTLSRDV